MTYEREIEDEGEWNWLFNGLYTLLCKVECILNDRPILMNPTGLDDASALPPNMLLTFQRRTITRSGDCISRKAYLQRWWHHVQSLPSIFWSRFVAEYVPNPQNRRNWRRPQSSIKLGDIVLDSDINLHRGERLLGRLDLIQPRQYGHMRTESVLVAGKETSNDYTTLPPGEFMLGDVFLIHLYS